MFGQLVIGPPGSGKSTFCAGMREFLTGIKRDVAIINLDPANHNLPYKCEVDIRDLIILNEVMEELELGPNGALIYCMEYLEKNIGWLKKAIDKLEGKYLIFDFPGQVELFTQHRACKKLAYVMTHDWNYRLCAVHLVDAHHCTDPNKYISVVLISLTTMLHLETPHVNFLSKCDLIEQYGRLKFGLQFYTDVVDMKHLIPFLSDEKDPFSKKHKKLSENIVEVVEDFSLVNFSPLSVVEKESMKNALKLIDKANGYVRMPQERNAVLNMVSRDSGMDDDTIQYFRQKYTHHSKAEADEKKAADSMTK
mmetsp:Transcript_30757/g.43056  ORF Transcript_30757/g.43056 Transcript_30757/m.43056 type:complete len:308 (-) Transcript_30757:54-977(-)